MRIAKIVFLLFTLVLCFTWTDVQAQRHSFKSKLERNKSVSRYSGGSVGGKFRNYAFVGVGINALNYYGDLAPVSRAASTDISFTRPGAGFTLGYRFSPTMALRGTLNYGRLKGDDFTAERDADNEPRYLRNLSFRNDIIELNLGINYYFIPDQNGPNFRNPVNFYLFVGAGVFTHTPKGRVPELDYQLEDTPAVPEGGEWVNLRDLGTEGQNLGRDSLVYGSFAFNIPIMLGALIRIPGTPFNAQIETGVRILFTDYIDDVSSRYVGLDQFPEEDYLSRIMSDRAAEPTNGFDLSTSRGDLSTVRGVEFPDGVVRNINGFTGSGLEGTIRGNPDNNDLYWVTQIKLVYIIQQGRSSSKRSRAKFR